MLIGIAAATTKVLARLRRKSSSTVIARMPPITRLCRTKPMALYT